MRTISLRQGAVLSALAIAFVTAAVRGPLPPTPTAPAAALLAPAAAAAPRIAAPRIAVAAPRRVVLVVGDSLIAQASGALRGAANSAVDVRVAAQLGSAPCDWTAGVDGRDFEAALASDHPSVVVFAFAGNSGGAAGCVDDRRAYPLAKLLNNYRDNLTRLADEATAAGAAVVISTPPARNPAEPAPPAVPTTAERKSPRLFYGFQGVPQIRSLYADMVTASGGRWHLSDAAALAVSPGFRYVLKLTCVAADGPCPSGVVAVRAGGRDAIHFDAGGHGAWRFARTLVSDAMPAPSPASRQAGL